MPAEAESLLPHWKLLTEAAVAATFRPQPALLHTLEQELLNPGCVDTVLQGGFENLPAVLSSYQ